MTRRLVLVAVVLTAAALGLTGWHRLQIHGERQEGLRLVRSGSSAAAEPLLQRALARDPRDVEVLSALAVGKLGADEPAAEEHLSRWCELRPDETRPFRLRMELRHRQGRQARGAAERLRLLEQALADGRRVLERSPNDEVRREVVWLLLGVGRFDEAERECRRCLVEAPADLWLHFLLARACHGQGRRAEAEALLDPVVREQPRFPEALLLRATLHCAADQPDRAVPLLRQALGLPGCPRHDCLYQLGLALAAAGQAEEARRVMAEVQLLTLQTAVVRDHFPDNAAMRVQIAEAMLDAGRAEEARAVLEKVLTDVPDFAPARRLLERLTR